MTFFLWFIAVAAGLSVVGCLFWLYTGNPPPRTPFSVAVNVAMDTVLFVWAIALLVGVAA